MKKSDITPRKIKTMVEYELGIDNIAVAKKTNRLVFARYLAVALCSRFTTASLAEIGVVLDKDHATILHAQREWEDLVETKSFVKYKEAYLRLFKILSDGSSRTLADFISPLELSQKYRAKLIRIIDTHHSIRRKLQKENEELKMKISKLESHGNI